MSREDVRAHHGGQMFSFLQGERLEYQSNTGEPLFLWDAQGWYGGDREKLWVKTEGEVEFGGGVHEAELQALYSRAISPFFDFQIGLRQDFAPDPLRTFAVIGVQGLAPYFFETDTALFISHQGDVSARLEAELDLLLTQRLILQPRTEFRLAAQDVAAYGIGAGLNSIELGARLRYEIVREFGPYVGISWHRDIGETALLTRAAGENPDSLSFVAGIRVWH